ncbi:MAG: ABC transporter ATP-binding protein/permease [Methylobacteriaceae bacterium]|nr:ABC transporter ATP-binding protein/permease [Methylobacteriaceae bacterium]MBV9703374.1 ABC transporter ATP-binding protein/permease [Methylobacteriaceae bacterium]
MAEQPTNPSSDAPTVGIQTTADGVIAQVAGMASALWSSKQRNKILMLAAALIGIVGATAYAQVQLNAWNKPFYNSLADKNLSGFVQQLGVFAVLAGILLALNVAQTRLNQISKVILRQGLVDNLMTEWLRPLRAFRLSHAGEIGANPDQRIQEDAKHLTELTTDLGIGLLQSTLLLLSFVGVLWVLSSHMVLSLAGREFTLPGYMVWCALIYAGTASFFSSRVGRPLIVLNAEHYAREAEFRFALVRINENIDGIALYGGEADEKGRLDRVFDTVLDVSRQMVGAATRLTWVTAGYGWFTIAAPILVAAPAYFKSDMSFGELMTIVGAFNQVQQALRWYVDNFSSIADWRATLLRVASFRRTILTMDKVGEDEERIQFHEGNDQSIRVDDLRIATHTGCIVLSEPHAQLNPGEHILITSENGEEKASLFRAMGRLWPWGTGRITYPARESLMFLPVRAYVPPGTLRAAVMYPHSSDAYEASAVSKALVDVGLEHLEDSLDVVKRWDRKLNDDEKQRLAFARVILQKPRWLIANDAFDVLDPESRKRIREAFAAKLANIGVINVGHDTNEPGIFARKLYLTTQLKGPTFSYNQNDRLRASGQPESSHEALSTE